MNITSGIASGASWRHHPNAAIQRKIQPMTLEIKNDEYYKVVFKYKEDFRHDLTVQAGETVDRVAVVVPDRIEYRNEAYYRDPQCGGDVHDGRLYFFRRRVTRGGILIGAELQPDNMGKQSIYETILYNVEK